MLRFCDVVIARFRHDYQRAPTDTDVNRIVQQSKARDFPDMQGLSTPPNGDNLLRRVMGTRERRRRPL